MFLNHLNILLSLIFMLIIFNSQHSINNIARNRTVNEVSKYFFNSLGWNTLTLICTVLNAVAIATVINDESVETISIQFSQSEDHS